MSGVQEKKIPQFIYTDQINYPNHVRLFVLSVFFIALLDYVLFASFYSFSANVFTTWTTLTLTLLLIFYAVCHFSLRYYSSSRFAGKTNITFQVICFFTGLLLGISTICAGTWRMIWRSSFRSNAGSSFFTRLLISVDSHGKSAVRGTCRLTAHW